MKIQSIGSRGQAIALAACVVGLALIVARWASGNAGGGEASTSRPPSSAPVADPEAAGRPDVSSSRARRAGKSEAAVEDVPPLRKEDLAPRKPAAFNTEGRDLFDFRPPTPVPPTPPPPTPTPRPVCGDGRYIGPCPAPPPPPPTSTPSPPEITFKCIGTFGPKSDPIAVLVQGSEIINSRIGDAVFSRFKVVRVGYESVDIGFVAGAWHWEETRRLACP